jgi:cbb3-type cytochrome oxidase subunit 3
MPAKKIVQFLLLPLILLGFFVSFSAVSADDSLVSPQTSSGNYGLDVTAQNTGLIKKEVTPQKIAGTIVSSALSLLGVLFFLLVIYGGLRWMLSQGNESEVEKAKQVIIAAVIGLIVVLSAYAITTFIGNAVTQGQ